MAKVETIEELLHEFDRLLEWREKKYIRLDDTFCKNGQILKADYSEYKRAKQAVVDKFDEKAIYLQELLDKTCKKIRRKQPDIVNFTKSHINLRYNIPRKIVFGRIKASYGDKWEAPLPKAISFPIKKPLFIEDVPEQWILFHRLYLRLLYALPLGKAEFYVYDPVELGYSVRKFTNIFSVPEVSPPEKVMTNLNELKVQLKKVLDYAEDMIQNLFTLECHTWEDYNRRLYSQNLGLKELPYKIFTFFSFPCDLDEEAMEMIHKILNHSERCGFLVLFAYRKDELEPADSLLGRRRHIMMAQAMQAESASLSEIYRNISDLPELHKLTVREQSEAFPDDELLVKILDLYLQQIEENKSTGTEIEKIYSLSHVFERNSKDGLCIPVGFSDNDHSVVEVHIGDETPHYLVGGTTGSGKSNLLHILIQSACVHYSPQELNVYLLDFKEGVEFNVYADPALPHAQLVATEADTEYGVTVLRHLDYERERRYALFKKHNVKDIRQYREQCNDAESMPRILLIIDEFQVLFNKDSKTDAVVCFESLAKQGRACGIHMILSTQTLKNLDFTMLGTQFGGRIALRCASSEDSRNLLGGSVSSSNDAAVKIKIPYAILNTDGGVEDSNIKTYIPEAVQNREIVSALHQEGFRRGLAVRTRIYSGNQLPVIPERRIMESTGNLVLHLGKILDYDNEPFKISIEERSGSNLLVCGSDRKIMHGLMRSAVLSAVLNQKVQELLVVGKTNTAFEQADKPMRYYENLKVFLEEVKKEDFYNKRRIVILNECNPVKDVGYSTSYIPATNQEALQLKAFFEESAEKGTTIFAFYERFETFKASAVPVSCFEYRIGFEVSTDTLFKLAETSYMSGVKTVQHNRAFSLRNGAVDVCFLPYVEN